MTPCSRLRYATFIAMAPAECEPEPDCDPNGVLATCLTLHSVSTCAVTEWDEDRDAAELLRMEAYLQCKLDNWTDCPKIPDAFDSAVKVLVRIALAEWRTCPRHPWAKLHDPQLESLVLECRRVGDHAAERALSAYKTHRYRLAVK